MARKREREKKRGQTIGSLLTRSPDSKRSVMANENGERMKSVSRSTIDAPVSF